MNHDGSTTAPRNPATLCIKSVSSNVTGNGSWGTATYSEMGSRIEKITRGIGGSNAAMAFDPSTDPSTQSDVA